ncbi:MAG: hypothetical protein ACUVUE_00465 [Candidatus Bathycorpusculaceae bacterium]
MRLARCGKTNPFAEEAEIQKIADQTPPKGALKIAEKLSKLGSINVHV